ncbi:MULTISPECIES: RNA polymerase subunit sigma [unclassified Agrococcus]|uniref:DUF7882 family protein n=1 Tax=unclassified Agrococcus TaxID=2615065 RepID=UPI0036171E4A
MGTLHYGIADAGIRIDDETLAHLAAVMVAKLRRHEPFLLTCRSESSREAIWLHGASTVRFSYDEPAPTTLDKARLEAMVKESNRPTGLVLEDALVARPAAVEALAVAA